MEEIKNPIKYLEQQADGFKEDLKTEYRNWKEDTESIAKLCDRGYLDNSAKESISKMLGIVKEEFSLTVGEDVVTVFREGDRVRILIGDSTINITGSLSNGEVVDFVFSIRDSFDFRK